jgi:hypothetical protein
MITNHDKELPLGSSFIIFQTKGHTFYRNFWYIFVLFTEEDDVKKITIQYERKVNGNNVRKSKLLTILLYNQIIIIFKKGVETDANRTDFFHSDFSRTNLGRNEVNGAIWI